MHPAHLSSVHKSYGSVEALQGLDLTIGAGELVALLGANGAGKTTAVRLLLGLAKPSSGTVRVFGGDPRDASTRSRLGAVLQIARVPETLRVAGSITFCALGLAVGFLAGPNSAAPIVNLIYLPLGFLSGLWMPIMFLPQRLQEFALWLPPYHFGQLALRVIGASQGEPLALHIGAMIVATVLFLAIAWIGYRRDEGKLYG